MRVIAVIPAYNEATTVADVLRKTAPLVDGVIVVDDGSTDATAEVSRDAGAIVVRHALNRGLGAALGTGFSAAQALGADAVITLDADGQHDPDEIPTLVQALRDGADFVIGSRLIAPTGGMPWYRVVANWLGNITTLVLFGAWVSDSQSGFRALNRRALKEVRVRSNRMEVSCELVAEARRHHWKLKEVPIKAIYTTYSLSKGNNMFVGVRTLAKLVFHRLTH